MACCRFNAPSENHSLSGGWLVAADRRLRGARDSFAHCIFKELCVLGRAVSFQITILKVLAGQLGGRASLVDLRRAVGILISSGPDWTDRTKRLAAHAPGLDIFTQSFVLRDDTGWQITDAGRAFLTSVETPIPMTATNEPPPETMVLPTPVPASPAPLRLIGLNGRRPQRRRPANRIRSSAA